MAWTDVRQYQARAEEGERFHRALLRIRAEQLKLDAANRELQGIVPCPACLKRTPRTDCSLPTAD